MHTTGSRFRKSRAKRLETPGVGTRNEIILDGLGVDAPIEVLDRCQPYIYDAPQT